MSFIVPLHINKATNGIWLPAPYALVAKVDGTKWGEEGDDCVKDGGVSGIVKRLDYMCVAMLEYGQFHHTLDQDYSPTVKESLNEIHSKYKSLLTSNCPECKDEDPKPVHDPRVSIFAVVQRLDTLSRRLRGFLQKGSLAQMKNKETGWKKNLLTAEKYAEDAVAIIEKIDEVHRDT